MVQNDHMKLNNGADHGLEIDQYAVEDVQIIKGLMFYGSDAIGGVIDIRSPQTPAKNTFSDINLTGETNNELIESLHRSWLEMKIGTTVLELLIVIMQIIKYPLIEYYTKVM